MNLRILTRPTLTETKWELTYLPSEVTAATAAAMGRPETEGQHRFQLKPESIRTASPGAIRSWALQATPFDNMGAMMPVKELIGLMSFNFDLIIPGAQTRGRRPSSAPRRTSGTCSSQPRTSTPCVTGSRSLRACSPGAPDAARHPSGNLPDGWARALPTEGELMLPRRSAACGCACVYDRLDRAGLSAGADRLARRTGGAAVGHHHVHRGSFCWSRPSGRRRSVSRLSPALPAPSAGSGWPMGSWCSGLLHKLVFDPPQGRRQHGGDLRDLLRGAFLFPDPGEHQIAGDLHGDLRAGGRGAGARGGGLPADPLEPQPA